MQLNNSIRGIAANGSHIPVLASELVDLLDPQPDDTIIDCTFGAGGHARRISGELGKSALFIGIDRDPVARRYFDLFSQYQPFRCRFLQGNFADALEQLDEKDFEADLVYMEALKLGIRTLHTAVPPLANGSAQPSVFSVTRNARLLGYSSAVHE